MASPAPGRARADKQKAAARGLNGTPTVKSRAGAKRKRGPEAAKSGPSPVVHNGTVAATRRRQEPKAQRPDSEPSQGGRSTDRPLSKPAEQPTLDQARQQDAGASRLGDATARPPSSANESASGGAAALGSNWAQLQAELTAKNTGKGRPGRARTPHTSGPPPSSEAAPAARSGPGRTDTNGAQPLVESLFSPDTTAREAKVTKVVAMDCEMVGVGREGRRSILARVSLVNEQGQVLYDKFVRPKEKVKDFRTAVSGIRRQDLAFDKASDFFAVQKEVGEIIRKRILVGHALHNDLEVLMLSHPRRAIRDTQRYKPFRGPRGSARSLKNLAREVLQREIQEGAHDSVEDARCALQLYLHVRSNWERSLRDKDFAKANKSFDPVARRVG